MNTILVLIEGHDELKPIVRRLNATPVADRPGAFRARLDDQTEVVVVTTGVGPDQAERVAMECLDRFQPVLAISAGTCGALVAGIEMSDWLVTGNVQLLEGTSRVAGKSLESSATEAISQLVGSLQHDPVRHAGQLVTVSGEPVIDAAEKESIARQHNAVAVDMESYGIARAATDRGIAWLIARVVVDTPDQPLPKLGSMNIETGRPPLGGILAYVLRNPIDGPRTLYGLWHLVQVYAGHLARVLPGLAAS
jgi:nucleoside phosphorylase